MRLFSGIERVGKKKKIGERELKVLNLKLGWHIDNPTI